MINKVTITNSRNESVVLDLFDPWSSGFAIRQIDGLGPVNANITVTDYASKDGAGFNGARQSTRNIVFDLVFLDTNATIEQVRHLSYKYFPVKEKIDILVETDERMLETSGYVESNEPSIFDSELEGCQVSVLCESPFFESPNVQVNKLSDIRNSFHFPFSSTKEPELTFGYTDVHDYILAINNGDVDTGCIFEIQCNVPCSSVTIYKYGEVEPLFKLTIPLKEKDILIINTETGKKAIYLVRDGVYYNAINYLDYSIGGRITWPILTKGDNAFSLKYEAFILKKYIPDPAASAVSIPEECAETTFGNINIDISPVQEGSGDPAMDNVRNFKNIFEINATVSNNTYSESKNYKYYPSEIVTITSDMTKTGADVKTTILLQGVYKITAEAFDNELLENLYVGYKGNVISNYLKYGGGINQQELSSLEPKDGYFYVIGNNVSDYIIVKTSEYTLSEFKEYITANPLVIKFTMPFTTIVTGGANNYGLWMNTGGTYDIVNSKNINPYYYEEITTYRTNASWNAVRKVIRLHQENPQNVTLFYDINDPYGRYDDDSGTYAIKEAYENGSNIAFNIFKYCGKIAEEDVDSITLNPYDIYLYRFPLESGKTIYRYGLLMGLDPTEWASNLKLLKYLRFNNYISFVYQLNNTKKEVPQSALTISSYSGVNHILTDTGVISEVGYRVNGEGTDQLILTIKHKNKYLGV